MKKLKKLTRRQKELLTKNGYDHMQYLLERQNDQEHTYTYVNRKNEETLVLTYK